MARKSHSKSWLKALVIALALAGVAVVFAYMQETTRLASKAAPAPATSLPVASDNEKACQTVSNVLTSTGPLKIATTGGISYNWGNLKEKWFRDAKDANYYIYPELTNSVPKPTCLPWRENPDCTLGKNATVRYVVKKWNNGLQKNGMKPQTNEKVRISDTSIAIESKACYDAIKVGFTFPKANTSATHTTTPTTTPKYTQAYCEQFGKNCPPGCVLGGSCPTCKDLRCNAPTPTPRPSTQVTPITTMPCKNLVDVLNNVAPLKVTSSISLNWGGIYEKWFQDDKSQWYYIYKDASNQEAEKYAVRKWNGGLNNTPNIPDDFSKDPIVTPENEACYNAITPSYIFPTK